MIDPVATVDADAVVRALRALGDDADGSANEWAERGEIVAQRAAQLAPRRSGRLARSVGVESQAGRAVVAAGFGSVPYAAPIHFGWRARNIRAQPFLFDALDERRQEVVDHVEQDVIDAIAKHGLA